MDEHRQIKLLARSSLTDEDCPSPDELAAYALGALGGAEQLRVAAHVRGCPLCTELVAIATPAPRTQQPMLAQLLPIALSGVRSDVARSHIRQYIAADVVIELSIGPPVAGRWTITGQVLRQGEGLSACQISIRAARHRARTQTSDPDGFFSFGMLPEGTYRLAVRHAHVQVEIRDLGLRTDDE